MDKTNLIIEDVAYQSQAREVTAWLGLTDNDYLAARTLLRKGLLIQGAIFASSAIEKPSRSVVHKIGTFCALQ